MKLLIGILIQIFFGSALCASSELVKAYTENDVVPRFYDTAPTEFLEIIYEDKTFELYHEFKPTEVIVQPKDVKWPADPNKFYTLLQYTHDYPGRDNQKQGPFATWVLVNIPGNDWLSGDVIVEYCGAAPDKRYGGCRYPTTIHEQPGKIEFNESFVHSRDYFPRLKWPVRDFVDKYKLGPPLYGHMHTANWEPYVDDCYKEWRAAKRFETRRPEQIGKMKQRV